MAGCSSPPANQGLLLGIEHTTSQSTAQHGVTQRINLGTQGVAATQDTSTHSDSQTHVYITNQRTPCPACGTMMLGKNINRHLQMHCKSAAPGAHFSLRPARRDFASNPPQPPSPTNTAQARVPCPHCHTTIAHARNLKRHLLTCKVYTQHARLQVDGVSPRPHDQTAGPSGSSPTTPQTQHSGSTHHDPGTPPGVVGGGSSTPPLVHTPMRTVELDFSELEKHDKRHFPAVGSKEGKARWAHIDTLVSKELPCVFPGDTLHTLPIDHIIHKLHTFIRTFFASPPHIHANAGEHRRRSLIPPGIRRRQRQLRRDWNRRNTLPEGTVESLRKEYHTLRRHIRRRVRLANLQNDIVQRGQNVRKFRQDPHKFADTLLNKQLNHTPTFDKPTADAHFLSVYMDNDRSHVYENLDTLPHVPLPSSAFSDAPPTLQEVESVIKKARNKSAPGPSGISYVAFKMLPSLLPTLHALFVRVWTSQEVPQAWRVAHMILLAKSTDTSSPSNMRNIALGNSEGKLFFGIVARRINKHMLQNTYFDGITQKGFMPGVAGCVEHASVMREALGDARRRHKSICVSWVDFANAFGSVRHSLIQFALTHYHFSPLFRKLIYHYYDNLFAVVHTRQFSTQPFHYGIGVFQGCTTSPALFNVVMQLLLDIINRPANRHLAYKFPSHEPPFTILCPTFADDISLVTETPDGNQHLLDETAGFCEWSGMALKPPKCFALAYKIFKGASSRYIPIDDRQWTAFDPRLVVQGHTLHLIAAEGFKYLGKLLEINMDERHLKAHIEGKLKSWMELIDKCLIDRAMKCWIYNFTIISKLSWWFTVGDLSVTFAKFLHAIVLPYLKEWCGLPKSGANCAVLFVGSTTHLGLSLRRIHTVYKAMQVVRRGILKKSKDPVARHVFEMERSRQESWSGPRFAPALEVTAVEAQATLVEIPGHHHGLGFKDTSIRKDKPPTSLQMYTTIDSRVQLDHASTLVMQGKLQLFDECLHRDWAWDKLIYNCSDSMFRFMINATNNTLPTGSNLRIWSNSVIQTTCAGCHRLNPTLLHVLNGCPVFLKQGRYTWRHDSVLDVMYTALKDKIKDINANDTSQVYKPYIEFVSESHPKRNRPTSTSLSQRKPLCTGLLHEAGGWEVIVDAGTSKNYIFPPDIAISIQRPDICIISRSQRKILLMELTVPIEECVLSAATRKTIRYRTLANDIASNNWECHLFTIEVGSRGNDASSLGRCLTSLGFTRRERQQLQRSVSDTARKASYFIYLKRNDPTWTIPAR